MHHSLDDFSQVGNNTSLLDRGSASAFMELGVMAETK